MSAPAKPAQHSRVQALDLLRLLAALMVVIYHYGFRGAAADGYTHMALPDHAPLLKYVAFGVQLFFVISGFVIAYSAERRSVAEFAVARFSRIYPGFVVCMTLTFLVTWAWGAPVFATSPQHWFANLFIFAPALGQPFMDGAYWSIVYELVFYGWIAILLGTSLFPRRLDEVVMAWLVISLGNELFLGSDALQKLFLTDYSGFFSAGLMLYALERRRRDPAAWLLLVAATGVAAVQAAHNSLWSMEHYHVYLAAPVEMACAVFAVALVGASLFIRRVPLPPGLVLALGGITYPFYLLHQHIGYIIANRLEGLAPAPVLIVGLIVAIALLSWAIWRFIERPAQRALRPALNAVVRRLPWMVTDRRQPAA